MHDQKRKQQENNKYLVLSICLTVLYLLIHVILLQYHEMWRDEAQAWVLVKNLSMKQFITRQLSIEGHPMLWYAIIAPFVRLGLPFQYLGYISLAFMSLAVFICLRKAPFPFWVRVMIITCSAFMYFNPVIARIYSVAACIVIFLAAYWKERFDKPVFYAVIVALLFQSHILFAGLGIAILIDFIVQIFVSKDSKQKKKVGAGIAIMALSLFVMILELKGRDGIRPTVEMSLSVFIQSIKDGAIKLGLESVVERVMAWNLFTSEIMKNGLKYVFIVLLCSMPVILLLLFVKGRKNLNVLRSLFVSLCGIGYYFTIICLVRRAVHEQLGICVIVLLLFSVWILYEESKDYIPMRHVLIGWAVAMTVVTWIPTAGFIRFDLSNEFSGSKAMAEYIKEYLPEDSIIVVNDELELPPVYAYVTGARKDITFWTTGTKDKYMLHDWSHEYPVLYMEEVKADVEKYFAGRENVYYLSTGEVPEMELMFCNKNPNYWKEYYWLYQVKE